MSEAISRPAPLIGRAREWRALEARCERVQQGRGGLFWLVGEAGIGKSALMGVLDTWAETQGFAVLRGRHVGHRQAPPLHGLREMLRQLFAPWCWPNSGSIPQPMRSFARRAWPARLGTGPRPCASCATIPVAR